MPARAAPRPSVLVVDDDAAALQTLEALLGDDFDVECVPDGAEAEAALARRERDVVVTDHAMPGFSGLDLLRTIAERYPNMVGILVTGHSDYPEIEAALSNWRDYTVLLKPYDPAALLHSVRTAAMIARLRRATRLLGTR